VVLPWGHSTPTRTAVALASSSPPAAPPRPPVSGRAIRRLDLQMENAQALESTQPVLTNNYKLLSRVPYCVCIEVVKIISGSLHTHGIGGESPAACMASAGDGLRCHHPVRAAAAPSPSRAVPYEGTKVMVPSYGYHHSRMVCLSPQHGEHLLVMACDALTRPECGPAAYAVPCEGTIVIQAGLEPWTEASLQTKRNAPCFLRPVTSESARTATRRWLAAR
jgi:hypothetical protein